MRRREEGERERETLICCCTHLCIHWLILVCALTWICNLVILGQRSNQPSYLARAHRLSFYLSMDLVFISVIIFLIFKRSFVFSECSYLFKKIASWRLTIFWGSFSDLFVFKIFVCLYCRLLWSSLFLCFWALSHVGTFPQTLRNPFILCSYFC